MENLMQKPIVSGFAAAGVAAAILASLSFGAQGRDYRSEREGPTINQSTDWADARIAILKADLRLSPEQAQHWAGLQSALHDVAVDRSKRWASAHDLQTGRASSKAPVTSEPSNDDNERNVARERNAGVTQPDDIDAMRTEADTLTIQAADLRKIADVAQPLYDSLDERQRHRLVQFVRDDLSANAMNDRWGLSR
jgi:hypothetical protein